MKKIQCLGFRTFLHPNRPHLLNFIFHEFCQVAFLCEELRDMCIPKPSSNSRLSMQGVWVNSGCGFSSAAYSLVLAYVHQKLALGFIWKPHCSENTSKSPGWCRKGGSLATSVWFSRTGHCLLWVAVDPVWDACFVDNPLDIHIFVCSFVG